jgi:hypothetical protein
LEVQGEVGLNDRGIKDEGQERSGVGHGEEAEFDTGLLAARLPHLGQGAGGGEEQKRETDACRQQEKDRAGWILRCDGEVEMKQGLDKECEDGCGEESYMEDLLAAVGDAACQPVCEAVRVEITEEQEELKEDEAGHPDSGGAAEGGEDLAGGDRFNEEEKKG